MPFLQYGRGTQPMNPLTPFDTNWKKGSRATPSTTQDLFSRDELSIPTTSDLPCIVGRDEMWKRNLCGPSAYPACTSVWCFCGFSPFCPFVESTTCASSTTRVVRSPPPLGTCASSVQIKPPQPKSHLFQSLPQNLQPSEFVSQWIFENVASEDSCRDLTMGLACRLFRGCD